jgi:hypothetical protein
MAPPSSLPSAVKVANTCYDKYVLSTSLQLDPLLRDKLDVLAEHFAEQGILESIFIDRLVPWVEFLRPPNPGHSAIADFLICKAAISALSANFDTLIEESACGYGCDFLASLDGDEANSRTQHGPLLKFHGCKNRDRRATIWTKSQLASHPIDERIAKTRTWMAANLREKDLLIIGFWTDWKYLNGILASALTGVAPNSITVIDPAPTSELESKAPDLWQVSHGPGIHFEHVRESASDALDELRREFSRTYLRRLLHAGKAALENDTNGPCNPDWLEPPILKSEDLYQLRRDAEGVPSNLPATRKDLGAAEALGLFHLLLRRAGALLGVDGYTLNQQKIRVINGSGRLLNSMRTTFKSPPAIQGPDIVVCVGATDFNLPDNVVRSGRPEDIIRNESGAKWVEAVAGRKLLNI